MSSEKEFTVKKKVIQKDKQDKSEEGKSRTREKSTKAKDALGASQAICEEKTKHAASEKSTKAKSLTREKSAIEIYPDKDMKLVYRGDKNLLVKVQRSSLEEPQQYSFQSSSIISSVIPPQNKQTLQIEVESREEDTTIEIKLLENQETSERLKETTKASSKGSSERSSLSGENINKNVIPDKESETFAIGKPKDCSESRTASLSKQSSEESSVTGGIVSVEGLENFEGETPAGKLKKTDDLPLVASQDVSGQANPTPLWVQILKTHPLEEITDSQIYFTKLYDDFRNKIIDTHQMDRISTEFLKISNDYERIKYVIKYAEVRDMIVNLSADKSDSYAYILENQFETYNYLKNPELLDRGYELISRSIQYTHPSNTIRLAIRLMKRAWIKYEFKNYDGARIDAHKSVSYYDDISYMWQSYEILGRCYYNKNDCARSESYFSMAIDGLKASNADKNTKALVAKRIASVYKKVKGKLNMGRREEPTELVNPIISYRINGILKCATDAVEVKVNEEIGRGLYAKKEIKPGDVIIVEQPYASALSKNYFKTHCNNCYKRSNALVPCDICSRVWFCSVECLKESQTGFHSSECQVLNLLYDETIGNMGIIVFRILLTLTWEKIKSLKESDMINTKLPDSHPSNTEFNLKKKYNTEDYLNTYKLVTNSQKRNFDDLFKSSISAVYIKQCLKAVGFFKGEDVSLDDEIFVASLILRHLQNSSCNAYGITEVIVRKSTMNNVRINEVAASIYPTISLINHSCNPNVFRYSIGKDCIVRASKIIKKGEQLFDNYGSVFDVMGKEDRRIFLKDRYIFDCNCLACEEDWPLYEDNEVYAKFACPVENCDQIAEFDGDEMNCLSCGFTKKHKRLLSEARGKITELSQGIRALTDGCKDKAARIFKHFQMYADENIIYPSKCLSECQESFIRCYFLSGNLCQVN